MIKISKALFFYGLIVGLLGVPVALSGLLIKLLTGSWTVSHVGLWMMGGGFIAFFLGITIMNYIARKMIARDLERFMRQHHQSGEIIDVEPLPPTSEIEK